jgi:hypothetical protein
VGHLFDQIQSRVVAWLRLGQVVGQFQQARAVIAIRWFSGSG